MRKAEAVDDSAQPKRTVHRGDESKSQSMQPWSRALKGEVVKACISEADLVLVGLKTRR